MVHSDFSENFAYVAQDAAPRFHYNIDQCTVLPVVVYYRTENGIEHFSVVLLSDCSTHDATAVYIMQQKLIPEIRRRCKLVKKIIYVSDGAKQHFKNRVQMLNYMKHEEEFGIPTEWHSHATAHGKGSCDGIGAIVKREATRASLQASPNDAILDAYSLFSCAKGRSFEMEFSFYSQQDHDKTRKFLERRFKNAPPVTKIQKKHSFLPQPSQHYMFSVTVGLQLLWQLYHITSMMDMSH
ncbi:hypothetical protein QAD02_021444 [Eretmocerus hayati]|uniref:Uncharacterized protein n=1 Tax=Eretmocerus hayati TaxID=131215 RepID=A0ACC2PRS0_9HYME|nr:hypothetical protein QAD02_021444 [Eretmocerus hayati]